MSASARVKPKHLEILHRQMQKLSKFDHPHLLIAVDMDSSIENWYALIAGLPEPFSGGEYIVHFVANSNYPISPPLVYFRTPNGTFIKDSDICVSIGAFHAEDVSKDGSSGWRPAMGIIGFAEQIVNGLLNHKDLKGGVGIEPFPKGSDADIEKIKRRLAAGSRATNRSHHMMPVFEAMIASGPADKEPFKTLQAARMQ